MQEHKKYPMFNRACMVFFWFMGLTELYIGVQHIIPRYFHSDVTKIATKMLTWCIAIQCFSNWIGVRMCSSKLLQMTRPTPRPPHTASSSQSAKELYYTWHHCYLCALDVPPRCHHCTVCQGCILQQDHHCFFTGTCIGRANQRHFVFFTFYMVIASATGFYYMVWYMNETLPAEVSWYQGFLPSAMYLWLTSSLTSLQLLIVLHLHFLLSCAGLCLYFFIKQLYLIARNVTSYEYRMDMVGASPRTNARANLREVLGPNWGWNFLIPFPGQKLLIALKGGQVTRNASNTQWSLLNV